MVITGLAPGSYSLEEVSTVGGYVLNTTPIIFSITNANEGAPETTVLADYVNYKAGATFTKVNEAGLAITGGTFEVQDVDGDAVAGVVISETATGVYAISNIPTGTYYLAELVAPTGYIKNTERIEFTVVTSEAGQPDVIALGNYVNYKGSAVLTKVDHDGEVLPGTTFKVIDSVGNDVVTGLLSNNEGLVTVDGLAPGTYSFVETASALGHIVNTTPVEFTIPCELRGQVCPSSGLIHITTIWAPLKSLRSMLWVN